MKVEYEKNCGGPFPDVGKGPSPTSSPSPRKKKVFSSPFQHALFRYGKEKTFEFRPKKLLGKGEKQRGKSTILKHVSTAGGEVLMG